MSTYLLFFSIGDRSLGCKMVKKACDGQGMTIEESPGISVDLGWRLVWRVFPILVVHALIAQRGRWWQTRAQLGRGAQETMKSDG